MANMIDRLISKESSILNDIHFGVIKDVAKHLEMDERTMRILHGSLEVGKTDLDSNAVAGRQTKTPRTTAERTLTVETTVTTDPDYLGAMTTTSKNQYPIYHDDRAGVRVAPIYVMKNIEYMFTYRSPSKTDVEDIRTRIFRKLTRTENVIGHKVEYTSILPKSFLVFLFHVYSLRNNVEPISFPEYVNNFTVKNLHQITDMSNEHNTMMAVREKQNRVIGVFDFIDEAPAIETDNDANQHTLRFGYRLQLEIPTELSYNFPVQIFNQPISNAYIDILEAEMQKYLSATSTFRTSISHTYNTLCGFGVDRDYYQPFAKNIPITIPVYDDESMNLYPIPGYRPVMSILITFDEDNPRLLLNLKDIGDYRLSSQMYKYVKENKKEVCSLYQDIVLFSIDAKGQHMGNDILEIDEDMNLMARKDLDITKNHRVVISALVDPTYIHMTRLETIFNLPPESFDVFLTELAYANNFEQGSVSSTSNLINLETILGHLIRRIVKLLSRKEYSAIVSMIVAVNESAWYSSALGEKLFFGYPETMRELYRRGICYLYGSFHIWILSDDDRTREGQIREHEYLYRINGKPSHGTQTSNRQPHFRGNPLTVMQNQIITLRQGD